MTALWALKAATVCAFRVAHPSRLWKGGAFAFDLSRGVARRGDLRASRAARAGSRRRRRWRRR
jgi:hypothetical protein